MSDAMEIQFEDQDAGQDAQPSRPLEVELESPQDPLGGKKAEELLAEIKAKEAEMTALKAQADTTAAMTGAFAGFGEKLEKVLKTQGQMQAPMPVQQPGESIEAFRERIRTDFLTDPFKAIVEVGEKLYGPQLAGLARATTSQSKELVMLQPEKRAIYEKYSQEVEALANRPEMLGNPRAYQEAVERVSAAHMNEIVEDRVSRLVEEKLAEALAKQGLGAQQKPASASAQFVETAPAKAPTDASGRRVVRLNAKQMAIYRDYLRIGMDKEQAAELAQVE